MANSQALANPKPQSPHIAGVEDAGFEEAAGTTRDQGQRFELWEGEVRGDDFEELEGEGLHGEGLPG